MPGPSIRTDIVEVFVFRRPPEARGTTRVEFLQLRRNKPPAPGSWQPIMGHIEAGETAVRAALRELHEEAGYEPAHLLGFWQLESLDTFFVAPSDSIMMCPLFAAEVSPSAPPPRLDDTHDAHRWIARDAADRAFLWPGQRAAIEQIVSDILPHDSPMAPLLRIALT
jgi:8-oxo-dGTP pyrophosphatase MutT (NUDIX family)